MDLTVQREDYTDKSTGGSLLVDGVFLCYTLEPKKDQSQGKPYCIPAGTYELILQLSPRFGMVTPHIQDVPGFSEIEIHPGNFFSDTEGCTLVGLLKGPDFVGQSRDAFALLMSKLLTGCQITYNG